MLPPRIDTRVGLAAASTWHTSRAGIVGHLAHRSHPARFPTRVSDEEPSRRNGRPSNDPPDRAGTPPPASNRLI